MRLISLAAAILFATASGAASLAQTAAPASDPPTLVDLPANGSAAALAIIYSGDGGWQDLDKTIGEWMTTQGIHVVGVDTLRTFWEAREPQVVAADLEAIVAAAEPGLPILIIGYSFGADVFPFAWPYIAPATQARIRLITLLAPEAQTAFHVSVVGWFGVQTGDNEVQPAISALPSERVLCVYGEDEEADTPCRKSALPESAVIRTAGGHHFDGDYIGLGRRILAAFESRLCQELPPAAMPHMGNAVSSCG